MSTTRPIFRPLKRVLPLRTPPLKPAVTVRARTVRRRQAPAPIRSRLRIRHRSSTTVINRDVLIAERAVRPLRKQQVVNMNGLRSPTGDAGHLCIQTALEWTGATCVGRSAAVDMTRPVAQITRVRLDGLRVQRILLRARRKLREVADFASIGQRDLDVLHGGPESAALCMPSSRRGPGRPDQRALRCRVESENKIESICLIHF